MYLSLSKNIIYFCKAYAQLLKLFSTFDLAKRFKNFFLGLKTVIENLTSWKAPSPLATGWWYYSPCKKLSGCQMNPNFCSINPAMVVPHNLTPVYIKGATKQKCEIQRNLTNTVLSPWIKFIAIRTRADVSAIQVNAIVATPTLINQAFVDIWSKIMNIYKIWMWTSTCKIDGSLDSY